MGRPDGMMFVETSGLNVRIGQISKIREDPDIFYSAWIYNPHESSSSIE